ncbi:hypothetical protein GCM10022234_00520 [Aeromicrobium panaciterrae]
MSNRQKPTDPELRRSPRPHGVVHSARFGQTLFAPLAWFKTNKMPECVDVAACGIRSNPKAPHFHPSVVDR